MMKTKRTVTVMISVALALAAILSIVITASANKDGNNYGYLGSDGESSLFASDILSGQLEYDLSVAEREFLDAYSNFELRYSTVINTDNVEITDGGDVKTVTAAEYVYTAKNGKELKWIPKSLGFNGTFVPFSNSDGVYSVEIESSVAEFNVRYEAIAEISEEDLDEILNLYYSTAKFAADIEDYNEKKTLYEDYLYKKRVYDDALRKYNKYLSDYEAYEKQKYEYDHYDELLEKYISDKADYEQYLEDLKKLESDFQKYEQYEKKIAEIRKKLKGVELMDVKMARNRTIYGAIYSGAVDQVLDSIGRIFEEIGSARYSKDLSYAEIVETARVATVSTRDLMKGYKECKTEAEKYTYYVLNYEKFCDSFFALTRALDALYSAPGVRTGMIVMEKHENYVILVAQLVLYSNVLIDGELRNFKGEVSYNSSWKIDGRTMATILENKNYFDDDDTGAPIKAYTGGYEAYPKPVEKPELKEVKEPTLPVRPSSRPTEPARVEHPGEAPKPVPDPTYPIAEFASSSKIYESLSLEYKADLAKAFKDGELSYRNYTESQKTIKLETIVYKNANSNQVTVAFITEKNDATETYNWSVTVDSGSPVVYNGVIPPSYENNEGSYSFSYWSKDENGEAVSLSGGFDSDTTLYAVYERIPTYYNVSWIVGDNVTTERLISGEIPNPGKEPALPDEDDYCYVFIGWDKELVPLESDMTYRAVFEKVYIVPTQNGGADISDDGERVICDLTTSANAQIDVSKLIEKIAGKRSLLIKTSLAEIEFGFTDVVEMKKSGVSSLYFYRTSDKQKHSGFYLKAYDEAGGELVLDNVKAEVSCEHLLADTSHTVFKNGEEYIAFTYEDSKINFYASLGGSYTLKKEYSIIVVNSGPITVSVSNNRVSEGDKVVIDIEIPNGSGITSLKLEDSDGKSVSFSAKNEITVGEKDIIITAIARYIYYNVTFVVGNNVVSSEELIYGSLPTIPKSPVMASDGTYSYTFIGWSPEVTYVVSDAKYVAQFEKNLIPVPDGDADVPLPDYMQKIIKIAIIAICSFILLLIGTIILIVFLLKRKKRKRFEQRNNKEANESNENNVEQDTVKGNKPKKEKNKTKIKKDKPKKTKENKETDN